MKQKQPRLQHTWQYYPKVTGNSIAYYEHWKCRSCGIVSLKNPFVDPGHIRDLEDERIAQNIIARGIKP